MWISFVVLGLTLGGVVWIMGRPWRPVARLLLVGVLVALFVVELYLLSGPHMLGVNLWYSRSPYWQLLLFVIMVLGMASRYMTQAIEVRRLRMARDGGASRAQGIQFDVWEFSYPLFVSVITFGALLSLIKDETVSLANAILSFQTGFFWQTILGSVVSANAGAAGRNG